MAFTVEDGTGVESANSYVAVADADTYFDDRGNATWTGADSVKQAALIKATAYLDGTYRKIWIGTIGATQGLSWPRSYAYDEYGTLIESVPQRVEDAVCELAVLALSTALSPELTRGGKVKKVKAGPVEKEYMDGAPALTRYPVVENLINDLISGSLANVPITRV